MAIDSLIQEGTSPIILLGIVFVYAVAVAAFLPFPAEAVLVVPLFLPFQWDVSFALVILVAAAGKAAGSLVAMRIGYGVSHSGPVVRFFEWIPYYKKFKRRTLTEFVRRHRYVGLALTLAIPFLPDTAPIYAFSVLENNAILFAAAAFVGTVIRLLIILVIAGGAVTVGT